MADWPLSSDLGPLGALPTAPRLARGFVSVALSGWRLEALSDVTELLVSELATNVVQACMDVHGNLVYDAEGKLPVLWVRLMSDRVRLVIEVWDTLPEMLGAPAVRHPDWDDESGRGLEMLETLAEDWGWESVPGWHGKRVWATLKVTQLPPPTPIDVARLAGVSHQTVSRVLNDHPNVKEQTRLRVQAAIIELGYRPNKAARILVTGTSQVIGVVSQSSTLFGPAATLSALAEAAVQRGFAVNVESVRTLDKRQIAEAIGRQRDQRIAGLVVIAPVESANEAINNLPDDIPLVTIDGDPALPTELVTVDQEAGAYAATRYLLEAGHATVVFAANDHLALGILRALYERGRRVPQDVSVIGFDDVPEAAYYIPPLTTVRPDFDAVAAASLDLLLAQIDSGHRLGDRRVITPSLVIRESVAPPQAPQ